MPTTIYKSPLIPVSSRTQTQKLVGCDLPKQKTPYSKYTVPHFMDVDDEEKYIVHGNIVFFFIIINLILTFIYCQFKFYNFRIFLNQISINLLFKSICKKVFVVFENYRNFCEF